MASEDSEHMSPTPRLLITLSCKAKLTASLLDYCVMIEKTDQLFDLLCITTFISVEASICIYSPYFFIKDNARFAILIHKQKVKLSMTSELP